MKVILSISFILSIILTFGQNEYSGKPFYLKYWFVGLGSNASWHLEEEEIDCSKGLQIEIIGNNLHYSRCEKTDEYVYDTLFNDTIWEINRVDYYKQVRKSSIDSIIYAIDTLKGKYTYRTNPQILSGGINNFYIEYDDWCTQFTLKNAYDSTATHIRNILAQYTETQHRSEPSKPIQNPNRPSYKPLIKSCPIKSNGSYREILEQEFEVLKNK